MMAAWDDPDFLGNIVLTDEKTAGLLDITGYQLRLVHLYTGGVLNVRVPQHTTHVVEWLPPWTFDPELDPDTHPEYRWRELREIFRRAT